MVRCIANQTPQYEEVEEFYPPEWATRFLIGRWSASLRRDLEEAIPRGKAPRLVLIGTPSTPDRSP